MSSAGGQRVLCIYHGNCADGFTAAWAVWKRLADADFHPGFHGEGPPNVGGRDVVLVDFAYQASAMRQMADEARSLLLLDHHQTARDALSFLSRGKSAWGAHISAARGARSRGLGYAAAVFDLEKSGARLAWELFHPGAPVPQLVLHVEDRDLWRFQLPGTREIQSVIDSYPHDFTTWTWLAERCESEPSRSAMINEGAAIARKHSRDVAEVLSVVSRTMRIGGIEVPVANLPHTMTSDGAGKLAENAPFAASYFDKPGGRVFSLRSRKDGGADVSAIAKALGGGGHRNAAGFQAPPGWEGED